MRHQVRIKKFQRPKDQREALAVAQVKTLFKYGKLVTTLQKANAALRFGDTILSYVQSHNDEQNLAYLNKSLKDPKFAEFVNKEVKPKLGERKTGFFKRYKLENRKGDNSQMAMVTMIMETKKEKKETKKTKAKNK